MAKKKKTFQGLMKVEIYCYVTASSIEEAEELMADLYPDIKVESDSPSELNFDFEDNSGSIYDWEVSEVED